MIDICISFDLTFLNKSLIFQEPMQYWFKK